MKVSYEKGDRAKAKELNQGILVVHFHNTDGTAITIEGIYEQKVLDNVLALVNFELREAHKNESL
jgi:hypothetical protein